MDPFEGGFKTLIEILRCPHCVSQGNEGELTLDIDNWMVCKEQDCGRKYPIYNGIPIMLTENGNYYHYRKGLEPADLRVHKYGKN